MYERLLRFLRCPDCQGSLELEELAASPSDAGREISEGLLHCGGGHCFPVVRNIPRMLPDSLAEHWHELRKLVEDAVVGGGPSAPRLRQLLDRMASSDGSDQKYDRRTKSNFSNEWKHFELGDRTWGMELAARVRGFFVEPIGIPPDELEGMVVLDAGCGNGTQSVAYTDLGLEVLALDLSSGVEHGEAFRQQHAMGRPDRVHFVQADLLAPPLPPGTVDIIHSAGVLHHTPDTEQTFRGLVPLLREGGTFYVWLYRYEPVVTPVVNTLRAATTRIPPPVFARLATVLAEPFRLFCYTVNGLGIRSYPRLTHREAALGLLDIFGAPHAHYHTYEEVARWYLEEGFLEVWPCNPSRRGFGICGRLGSSGALTRAAPEQVADET